MPQDAGQRPYTLVRQCLTNYRSLMPQCSFCSKPAADVKKLVEGPGVFICDECIALANAIVTEHLVGTVNAATEVPPKIQWWESLDDEEMLTRLQQMLRAADQVEDSLRTWVRELRRRGVTWARIGQALGMTRQSAWERFSGEE